MPPSHRGPPPAIVFLIALLAVPALPACGVQALPACDDAAYARAVDEAAEPSAADVSKALWAITPSNPKLSWRADRSAVLMVTWTNWAGYTPGDSLLSRDVWVTAVPQLKALCQTVAPDQQVARIQQVLGMPPASAAVVGNFFVELWVKPGDLFRPCADAEIDDTSCGLSFPPTATSAHKSWINAQYASSYGFWQQTKYPWTGLGYTYDWCNPSSTVGASEFVVRAGATVVVAAVHQRDAYCAP